MKSALSIVCLTLVSLQPAFSAEKSEIPIGIEAVTGIRSGYIYRGFKLADATLDFQVESEVAITDDTFLNIGAWYLAESDGDVAENGIFLDLRHAIGEKLILGGSILYRHFDHPVFDSGLDTGVSVSYRINDEWDWKTTASYDFGADGFYTSTDLHWSHVINESSFIAVLGGLSAVTDYYGRDGLNDFYYRLSYTYAISDRVALTPFVGGSVVIEDEGYLAENEAYAGFWFEVNF